MELFNGFPENLNKDVQRVLEILPKSTVGNVSVGETDLKVEYLLANEKVCFPYRVYLVELTEGEIEKLTDVQKRILYCWYSRSCNGYLREKYIKKILTSEFEEWCIPYIVKLCDEYVVEILCTIYEKLKNRGNADICCFCTKNRKVVQKSYSRMTSYWNEFYRNNECDFHKYIGRRLFRECLGYDRTFEKG